MVPAMDASYRPSFADGFAKFIEPPPIAAAVNRHLPKEPQPAATDPYDTHPPLKDRIAAVRQNPSVQETENTPAVTLLGSGEEVEIQLLQTMAPGRNVAGLRPMSWDWRGRLPASLQGGCGRGCLASGKLYH